MPMARTAPARTASIVAAERTAGADRSRPRPRVRSSIRGNPANLIVPAVDNTALTVDLDLYYADPNGNTMTMVVDQSGLPSWLSYDPGTHTFSGTPPVDSTWRRRHPRDGDGRSTARASSRR